MKIKIDGKEYIANEEESIIKVCDREGIDIPRFCYHEKLDIAGNCRMCLVEVEGGRGMVPSCVQKVSQGMNVVTNSELVRKTREGVMSMLLINHPLDCPVCDQGGECDLQDQAIKYGKNYSNYDENKRAVQSKDFGPFIATNMTRCIHCTRCVRFLEDVAGTHEIGSIGRGEDMKIDTYIEKGINSEISANIIDLCPVGALTSKPNAFTARPWELDSTHSIDVADPACSNIIIDSKNDEVIRIKPRENNDINDAWISDKTRFAVDSLKYQRIDSAMIRDDFGVLKKVQMSKAISEASYIIRNSGGAIGAVSGEYTDCETLFMAKKILNGLGSDMHESRTTDMVVDSRDVGLYNFNTSISDIEKSDHCLLIGSNPRLECPIVNIRLHKAVKSGKMKVFSIGDRIKTNYQYQQISDNHWSLKQIAEEKHEYLSILQKAKNPMIIIGSSALQGVDGKTILNYVEILLKKCSLVRSDWNGINIMPESASMVGAFRLGFTHDSSLNNVLDKSNVLILLGSDEIDIKSIRSSTKLIYIGSHGDIAAKHADIIIPSSAYTEADATYLNLEGRAQRAKKAVNPPGEAMPGYDILSEIEQSIFGGRKISLHDIRKEMAKLHPSFKEEMLNQVYKSCSKELFLAKEYGKSIRFKKDSTPPRFLSDADYYVHGTMGRMSPNMQRRAIQISKKDS